MSIKYVRRNLFQIVKSTEQDKVDNLFFRYINESDVYLTPELMQLFIVLKFII